MIWRESAVFSWFQRLHYSKVMYFSELPLLFDIVGEAYIHLYTYTCR